MYEPLNGLHDQRERQHADGDNVDERADRLRAMVPEGVGAGGLPACEHCRVDGDGVVERVGELVNCVGHDCDAADTHSNIQQDTNAWFCNLANLLGQTP